ncbi:MAG: enoyl-CoA hydratase/isomerase family protein [candidate division KSB1 bacterium]|nr:enoyl-CoA hydratase/isomerase family protein [candidate division KSB1 bacterium]MDZ7276449.1 enoyl-CoA hydratase/isomerase family protein [candidate division KSB1 bacterium]MDZ7288118.1 enoyl-CoA hydratase/isomerase family protein [candidate division KSB1 bacterium]MDZ7300219.1 enoyl-CoA hydratase/isomerase family protein [candidate division KSB1 bacterium]MDZ7305790.1 enoyl-CoA hydratase/isomerase family protein [candidate division KSB1 bacterium]
MDAYTLEQRDGIGILRLQAGGANALNERVLQALKTGLRQAEKLKLNGLVLTGYERFFCAGLDLIATYELNRKQMSRFLEDFDVAFKHLFSFPRPVVAAINGSATAGGCILALACDYRVMAADAGVIGLNEIRLGLPLPAVALEIARFSLPPERATYVLYSGKLFSPPEAVSAGLLHEVAPAENLLATAIARLHEFADHPGEACAPVKTALRSTALAQMTKNAGSMREAFLDAWFSHAARNAIDTVRRQLLDKKRN